ncbi:MAG: MoxR family ATPase [Candidatus Wallbacteria bacterium]|nr:MoxR family ATPase [Candidatus Wallbacteria bacterium]
MVGKRNAVELAVTALLARGHLLIEDVPGVGKTTLARAIARSIDCNFGRIQATSDLLPADVVGVAVFNRKTDEFEFREGPVFTNILLVDEINRAMPRTQSSLLQSMAECEVTVDGKTYPLKAPFFVIATQNPAEQVGTYFLPESQLDRFALRIPLGYPDRDQERAMIRAREKSSPLDELTPVVSRSELLHLQQRVTDVRMADSVLDYVLAIVERSRSREDLSAGASPRGALVLSRLCQAFALVRGRDHVLPDDVKDLAAPCLAHRLSTKTGFRADLLEQYKLVRNILEEVSSP